MIDHHGGAILKLAQVTGFTFCRAVQSELVAPRRLPDGLLEVVFSDQERPDLFLIEIETYPDRSVDSQVSEDILLTRLERGVVPDVITIVLRPKGNLQVKGQLEESSPHNLTRLAASWRVVELWNLSAEDLLAANDIGLIPWVPLTRFSGPPEQLLRQCRERIDRQAKPEEHSALLAVTAILAAAAFNDEALLAIFGGIKAMIESPLLNKIYNYGARQVARRDILQVLKHRFAQLPPELTEQVNGVEQDDRLEELHRFALSCPDVASFQKELVGTAGK